MKKIDQIALEELIALANILQNEIKKYNHVQKYLPKKLKNELYNFQNNILYEFERRELM